MSAIEGFLTGFANVAASNILERKKEARDYFNKQVEYARTTGLQNRQRVREQADTALSVARQLEAAGLPREIIMAQINQDPTNLSGFYDQAEKIRANAAAAGRQLTADDWNAIYKVAGEFKAPDEDLSTFIARTYDPIANAVADPSYEEDPEGSLWASMMGYNAMDRARADLSRTEIAEGLTAEQLIRYGDVTPQRVGGRATVVTDYAALPSRDEELSVTERTALINRTDEMTEAAISRLEEQQGAAIAGMDITPLRDAIVAEMRDLYPMASEETLRTFVNSAIRSRNYAVDTQQPATGPETVVEAPPPSLPTEGSPEAPPASSPPPSASTEVSGEPLSPEERLAAQTGLGYESIKDNGNGTITVVFNGQTRTYRTSDVRELLNRFMTQ
jgi:hypothetical protein